MKLLFDLGNSFSDALDKLRNVVFRDGADLAPEPAPSGENQEGKVWSWVPGSNKFELRHPKIMFGPAALDSSTGFISLVGHVNNILASGIPADGVGFRAGLSAYVPRGRYGLSGHVAIASPLTNKPFYVLVTQGTIVSGTAQPNILSGATVVIGGGVGVSPGVGNIPFSIPFSASDILNACAPGRAAEILVSVYPDDPATFAGGALQSVGIIPAGHVSKFTIQRWDGMHG